MNIFCSVGWLGYKQCGGLGCVAEKTAFSQLKVSKFTFFVNFKFLGVFAVLFSHSPSLVRVNKSLQQNRVNGC